MTAAGNKLVNILAGGTYLQCLLFEIFIERRWRHVTFMTFVKMVSYKIQWDKNQLICLKKNPE